MTRTESNIRCRVAPALVAALVGLTLSACGGGGSPDAAIQHGDARSGRAASTVIVRVGGSTVTRLMYDHWMTIGAATVTAPPARGALLKPLAYEPPAFAACVAHLQASARRGRTAAQLKAACKETYAGIQARILAFLITGYWLREQAAEQGQTVTPVEVRKKFDEERRAHYTAASFRRLREASRQTVPDLEFAEQTQMLSTKLVEDFTKTHPHETEAATIATFNRTIRATWLSRTHCASGYVVPDCKQYRRPKSATSK